MPVALSGPPEKSQDIISPFGVITFPFAPLRSQYVTGSASHGMLLPPFVFIKIMLAPHALHLAITFTS